MKSVTIFKQDYLGRDVWQYSGTLLKIDDHKIVIEAYFDREDVLVDGLMLRKGDRFIEIYYADQWYNIYEIYDRQNGSVKGWYCNLSYPAEFTSQSVVFWDLALDLLVYPDRTQVILDEDEFNSLPLVESVRTNALQGLKQLQEYFSQDNFSPTAN